MPQKEPLAISGKTIAFCTLGCKLNYAETSTIARKFGDLGYQRVPFGQPASVVVVNSCTVTQQSDKKCRQAIAKAVRSSPGTLVAVIGCYSSLRAGEIMKMPGVSVVLGTQDKFDVVNRVQMLRNEIVVPECIHVGEESPVFEPTYSMFDRTRSFLKIQDGCDYHCAYCTVALARGDSRNAPISSIVGSAKEIAAHGIREIVLTGVNIGDFGKTTGESFLQLLECLDEVKGVDRIRISSIEPNLLTSGIIDWVAGSRTFVPHWHLPLQSGSNRILAMMGRRYQREVFSGRVEHILRRMPDSSIGADVIVGFPDETESDFEDTYQFLDGLELTYLHVFPFSERPGTRAMDMPGKVPSKIKEERCHRLIALSEHKRKQFYERFLGKTVCVLFEGRADPQMMSGFTGNYIKVEVPWNKSLVNQICEVSLKHILPSGHVFGELISY